MPGSQKSRLIAGLSVALTAVTLVLYWPVTGHRFVNFDDEQYITANPHVTPGVTWSGLAWAFTSGYASNWHPLTWLSHMLDCSLYGVQPGGHHFTSLLIHAANSVLVLLLLRQLTGAVWRSAMVAALFAWHPLHVESVAWAAERKDVLSGLFWLLTMMAYVKYARGGGGRWYGLALALFALGLMCKPMLVTLPCVLLLIDYWPLRRWEPVRKTAAGPAWPRGARAKPHPNHPQPAPGRAWPLIREKLPFFALAAAASVTTFLVQKSSGAVAPLEVFSLPSRLTNAVVSYERYLLKALWPVNLAVFYPRPGSWPVAVVVIAAVLLAGLSFGFLRVGRTRPCLITGWLWYLGTLVPTIGIVQVGSQAMADRYIYLPSIGLFMLAVWFAADLVPPGRRSAGVASGAGLAVLVACLITTRAQLPCWRDSVALFERAIRVTAGNYMANAWLGAALVELGRQEEGAEQFRAALRLNSNCAEAHSGLGRVLVETGHPQEAIEDLAFAVRLQPGHPETHYDLATAWLHLGRLDEGIAELNEALRLRPEYPQALGNLGGALISQGKLAEGARKYAEAARLAPDDAEAQFNLGMALQELGQPDKSALSLAAAVRLKPDEARYQQYYGQLLQKQRQWKDALTVLRAAVRLDPGSVEAMNALAWLLATSPEESVRNGAEATRIALQINELKKNDPRLLLTLAAAQAETGRFSAAASTAAQSRDIAQALGMTGIVERAGEMVARFRTNAPIRDAP